MGLIFFVIYLFIFLLVPGCELYFLIKSWHKKPVKVLGIMCVFTHLIFLIALWHSFQCPGAYNFSGHGTSVACPSEDFYVIFYSLLMSIVIFIMLALYLFSQREYKG